MIDDSNEHMLSVWDCTRGTKQAEVKVRVKAAFWDNFMELYASALLPS